MIFVSDRQKQLVLGTIFLALLSAGSFFYYYQNLGKFPGGDIALSKILWLAFVIFFWFIAPILLLLNGTQRHLDKLLVSLHLSNVFLRAFIELVMMYQYNNWLPIYGIVHDVISMTALLLTLIFLQKRLSTFIKYFLIILTATFAIEAYFAQYMLSNVMIENGPVFFVPATAEHQNILIITWIVLIILTIYLVFFIRHWYRLKHD